MTDETKDIIYFAEANFRNQQRRFGIKRNDRGKHVYVIGKTGMGKTTLLENMVIQDIQNGDGVGVVDPHGEFAQKMLDFVPKERIADVIYLDPSNLAFPIGFNIMENVDPDKRHLVASGLMGVFKKIWVDVWSARMEYILGNTILALLEYPGSTLLSINRMLANKEFRKKVVNNLSDPVVKAFWVDEFAKYTDRYTQEALPAIQNKIGQFTSNPLIRNIIGQEKSSFDMRDIMDKRKILIMNLSKGKIGEENSRLLGAMLITRLYLAAMSRVEIAREKERADFYLYVDEFQNFAAESFANILSEARKYHLNLILAHQYITQMDETVRDAVFGNVGTMIAFRVGAADAEFIEKEFSPEFMMNDIVNLSFAHIYLKLMIDGVASRPFSASTLPPIDPPHNSYTDKIIETSQRYGLPRKEIEDIITASIQEKEEEKPRTSAAPQQQYTHQQQHTYQQQPYEEQPRHTENAQGITMYEAECSVCGKKTLVPFVPDGKRPIFCKQHRNQQQQRPEQREERQFARRDDPRTPPAFSQGGIPSIRQGEAVLRQDNNEQKTISLKALEPKKESAPRGPDIEGLRKILAENEEENEEEIEEDGIEEIEEDVGEKIEKPQEEKRNDTIMRPGDTLRF
ncbi:MAG: type IV secretion system DNA-binding domain-containing protein [bacterium]|nr:type IV secretion system DNA-binding domain-containing protein [bacterium]